MTELGWASPALAAAAAPAGIVVAIVARRGLGRGRPALARGAAAVRGIAVAAALLGAAGPHTVATEETAGVVLAAASDGHAVPGADGVLRWPSGAPDAAAAVETLRASLPSDRPASLVLAWPPDAAAPPGVAAAGALRPRGADVSVLRPGGGGPPAAGGGAVAIVAPAAIAEGVPFALAIDAGDRPFAGGRAVLAIDGVGQDVELPPGARRAEAPPVAVRGGDHVVSVAVPGRPPAAAVLRVAAPPSVLVVTSTGVEPPLARRLRQQGLRVTVASDAAADLAGDADVVVLGPGTGDRCAADVASRVAAGAGLLVVGGEGPRGLARLRGTALEAILPAELPDAPAPPAAPPVRPPLPEPPSPPAAERPRPALDDAERRALRVALLLCVDRSGSMAGLKMTMAREAAVAAARSLTPEDRIGVIAFDEGTHWVVPFQAARDMQAINRRVQALEAGGGTNFHPALRAGFAEILRQDCGIRHVVLLTDGATQYAEFSALVEGAAAQGVTLSTVAVGEGADTNLLGRLAQWGRGRLYPAVDPERLPEIVTLDTGAFADAPRRTARERLLAAEVAPPAAPAPPGPEPSAAAPPPAPPAAAAPRAPRVAAESPFLAGLEREAWPPLAHPETVRPRGAASVPLVWDDGTAALVLGRAGAGRAAVLAADAVTADAKDLWTWPEGGRALAQLVRFLAPAPPPSDASPSVRFVPRDGGRATAVVGRSGGGVLVIRPAGGGDEIRVVCRPEGGVSAGAVAAMPAAGVWVGEFAAEGDAGSSPVACGSPGPEPRDDDAVAVLLCERSGARLADRAPARRPAPPVERREDRSAPLILGAAVALVLEAALRRGVRG